MIKKYRALILILVVLALAGAAGVFFLFARIYQNDMQALTGFLASYETYEKAISTLKEAPASVDVERKTDQALAELNAKASVRISSLIKNEKKVMSTALEIADLSGKEFNALKAYQKAIAGHNPDLDRLAKELGELSSQRQAAFAQFLALGQQ